jgi:predicted nuclease of predicted toxin-antitoxin system
VKFLADIPIGRETVEYLRLLGHDCVRAAERLPANASDPEIIRLAVAEGLVVLCFDLDFAALVALSRERLPSVVTFRTSLHRPAYINQRLGAVLSELEPELARGALATVEDGRVRVRALPIRPSA